MAKQKRRSTTVQIKKQIEIERARLVVRGYDKKGDFVCRLEISNAGIEAFAGEKGGRQLCNLNWEAVRNALAKA